MNQLGVGFFGELPGVSGIASASFNLASFS
jgi:hypothetical protein